MRVILKSFDRYKEHYKKVAEIENEANIKKDIENGLSSIFLISQNIPKYDATDFFSGEDFSLMESFEELEVSYELFKLGFYKQAYISLRTALDIGLLSIYWANAGNEEKDFHMWLKSKIDSPYKNNKFWKILFSNKYIKKFEENFNIKDAIKSFDLSNYVHTKGRKYSNRINHAENNNKNSLIDKFIAWIVYFTEIIRILEVLHILQYPTLTIRYSTDFLLKKFGSYNKIPIFGGGYGGEMTIVPSFINKKEKLFIQNMIKENEEVKYIHEWLNNLPDLDDDEIQKIIIDDQKFSIVHGSGYNKWLESIREIEPRITEESIEKIYIWSKKEDILDDDMKRLSDAQRRYYSAKKE